MKLSTLLDQHMRHSGSGSPTGLPDSFGDVYLVQKNLIYRKIREQSLVSGFRYSNEPDPAYAALSLSQLESILQKKTIPYSPNLKVIEDLESKIPKQTDWDDIVDNFKGTHVFHEACHAVARSFVTDFSSKLASEMRLQSDESKILSMLLEESFANTCELLSIIDADDQVHRIFLELNSYVYMLEDRAGLANAARELGRPTLIRFLILAYLHANFLRTPSEKDFDRCFNLAAEGTGLDQKAKKSLRAISRIAFKLNPRFREVTTRFYLKLHGIKLKVEELTHFDFLQTLEKSKSAQNFLDLASQF